MLNLAPWYYKKLLIKNDIISKVEFFKNTLIDQSDQYETFVYLNSALHPSWLANSKIYKNCDGSGTSKLKNIAVYKGISEALERLAFYELTDAQLKHFCFDLNPTTTGMAAFPHFKTKYARRNAQNEAVERWAIHQFNKFKLPIKKHISQINNLNHYEIITPFDEIKVSLLEYKCNNFFAYGFAGGDNISHSFNKAIIELDRNIRVLSNEKINKKRFDDFNISIDRTITFFSQDDGNTLFKEKIRKAPTKITNCNPRVLCDKEIKGRWSDFTKVWRFLLEDSYFDCDKDHTFFMF